MGHNRWNSKLIFISRVVVSVDRASHCTALSALPILAGYDPISGGVRADTGEIFFLDLRFIVKGEQFHLAIYVRTHAVRQTILNYFYSQNPDWHGACASSILKLSSSNMKSNAPLTPPRAVCDQRATSSIVGTIIFPRLVSTDRDRWLNGTVLLLNHELKSETEFRDRL